MYKRITHNIVEEHYDHPALLPATVVPPLPPRATLNSVLPVSVMNEPTMLFRMDSRTLWSKFVWGLLNYGIALNNDLTSTEMVKGRAVKHADALGDFIIPFYGVEAGVELARQLGNFIKIGESVVQIVKDGGTVDGGEALWSETIEEISDFLTNINPDNWPKPVIKEYLVALCRFWIDEINTRHEQNWMLNEVMLDNLTQLIVTGVGINGGSFGSLADVFSRGIIMQFPDRFTQ